MADVQLLSESVDAAPKEYELPAGQELVLKACFANFDGSGAGSPWLPTLEIVSDSGHVAASLPMDASVAAGASVEGTWGPFLRGATPSGGGSFAASIGRYQAGFVSVPGLGGTADASWTYIDGAALLDLSAPTFPTVLGTGLYLWTIGWAVQGGGIAGRPFGCNFYQGFSGPPLYHEEDDLVNPAGGFGVFGTFGDSGILAAGTGVKARFVNNDNTAHNMELQEVHVVFVAT